jgi:hypothetical protein
MSTKNLGALGKIAIKPFSDPDVENMGLENYNYVVFPNTFQVEPLAAIEQNGKIRYLNGLYEFAPEIKQITDEAKKKAVIKDIRETVAMLERERAFNHIDVDDKDFWSKVEMFGPNNSEIWSKVLLKLGNDDVYLDPANNLDHLLIIKGIENGGFSLVATSWEDCKRNKKKWYLDRQIDTMANKVSSVKLKNKALALLNTLSDEDPRKLYYIAKNIVKDSIQYSNRTLPDTVYSNLDSYIQGLSYDSDKKRCASLFIEHAEMSHDVLKLKAIIKDASFHKYIIVKADGVLYEETENIMLGRNSADVLEFLNNPLNEDILDKLMARVEALWAK